MIELHSIEMERQLLASLIENQWAYDRNYDQLNDSLFSLVSTKQFFAPLSESKKSTHHKA